MASLLDWFGKRAEGVFAQLNPFDNGADYNSVVHGAPRQQHRPAPQPQNRIQPNNQPNGRPGLNIGLENFNMPTPQRPKVDINANAQLSQSKQQPQHDLLKDVGNFVNDNVVKPVAEDASKAYNTVAAPITGLTGAAMVGADNLFNGGRNADNLAAATKAAVDENVRNSFVPQNVARGEANPAQFAGEFAKTGIKLAPYVVNPGAGGLTNKFGAVVGGNVANNIARPLISRGAEYGANAAISAPVFAGLNAAEQGLNSNFRSFDPTQAINTGLLAGVSTLGGDIAGGALHAAAPHVNAGLSQAINAANIRQRMVNDLVAKGYAPERAQAIANRQLQAGFIAGPGATGFPEAQASGRVFNGVDDMPRFEVSDEGARLNQEGMSNPYEMILEKVLEHPELYKQYPELRSTRVEFEPTPGLRGTFDGSTITLNPRLPDSEMKSTLLHELQHAIQQKEGFASGGLPKKSIPTEQQKAVTYLRDSLDRANERLRQTAGSPGYDKAMRRKLAITRQLNDAEQALASRGESSPQDIQNYRNLAGEAEARAVQARMNMPDSERYVAPKKADDYGISHRPDEDGGFGYDISKNGEGSFVPEDVYDHPEWYFPMGGDHGIASRESMDAVRKIRNNPDAEVTVYRSGTKKELNSGDWITLSKKYADMHQTSNGERGDKVHAFKVKAKELRWPGDDINEFGYFPEVKPRSTFYDSLDVPKNELIVRKNGEGRAMSLEPGKPKKQPTPSKSNQRTLDAFNQSKNQRELADVHGVKFELGTFGENAAVRKAAKHDRLDASELGETLKNLKQAYRSSDNPNSYRSENIAWVAEMPDGEKRVVYTRKNARGAEEIINWHRLNKEKSSDYIASLKKFGTPARSRTGNFGLERLAGNPPHGSIKSEDRLGSELHSNYTMTKNSENVNRRPITTENVDVTRLAKDPAYQKEVQNSIFASGMPTDEALYKVYKKAVNPVPRVSKGTAQTGRKVSGQPKEQKISAVQKKAPENLAKTVRKPSSRARQKDSSNQTVSGAATPARQRQPQPARRSPAAGTPRNPSVRSITDTEAKEYVAKMSKEQDAARKATNDTLSEKAKKTGADFKEKFIDNLAPIEDRLNKAIKNGAVVDPKDHITYQLDRSRRAEGVMHAYMQDNGLDKVIQDVPNAKEFDQYLIAKHAKELDPEITTGRDKAKDAALVKALDSKYSGYAKKIYEYNQKLLDKSVEYGLISKATATKLKKQYPEYVPFNRIFNEDELTKLHGNGSGDASISKQTAVQKIKGSKRAIESPLNSIIDKTRVVVEQGERNRAAQLLASYRKLPDNPFNLKEIPANETIGTRHTISFLDKGVKRTFETDKEIADAAKNMTREQIGLWGRIAAAPARVLRAGATGVNAGFAGANVVKDIVGAAINSKHPMRIADPRNVGRALAAALNHNGRYYRELMREGVAGTSFDMYRNPNKLNIGEVRSRKNIGTRTAYNITHPSQWYRTVENTIGRSEDFGRALQYYSNKAGFLAEKKSAKDATLLAADQARNNSTNFFRHGSVGKGINLAVPYWNAGVQGARIGVRRIKERPVQTVAKIGLAIAAPSAMIALNNYGDEKKRKVIENIPDYEKEGNIIIVGDDAKFNEKTGRWEGVYKFPVPPQHIGIHNAIQKYIEKGAKDEPFDVVAALGDVAENYTTINPTNLTKTANNLTPQALKLVAEPMTNTNFFTRDKIVPESMRNLAAKDQKTKSTSLTARAIGERTGLSPMMVDNIIRTATGGAGQNVVQATDSALAAAGYGTKDDVRGRSLVENITDRFVGARGTSDGLIYYKTLDEAAKRNKLAGKDLAIFNSLVDAKMSSSGEIEGKNERDALNKYQNLASHPRVAQTISDAAKERSRQTGQPLDPLYQLPIDKQMKFYNIKSQNRDSQDQRDLENREKSWYGDFTKKRAAYYDALNLPPSKNNRVKYPEPSAQTQRTLDKYFSMPNGQAKYDFLDRHPEITKHFNNLAQYTNDVRKGQGVNPLRTYPQASKRVQQMMDAGNFKNPEVSAYLQALNIYNITKDGALAQIQGNDLSPKALKSINNMRYSLVKNSDGTYSLMYPDTQGSGKVGVGGATGASGRSGRRGGSRKKSSGIDQAAIRALAYKSKVPTYKAPPKGSISAVAASTMKKTVLRNYTPRIPARPKVAAK